MNNMEKSILEANGLTGRYYEDHLHSITEKEHEWFKEWKEANRRKKEKEKNKEKSNLKGAFVFLFLF